MSSSITLLSRDSAEAVLLSATAQKSDAGIVSRSLVQSPEMRLTLFAFASGQELTEHTNRRRALVQILEGDCDFLFAGRWQRLSAGMLLHLPPGAPHAVRATHGPFSMLLTLGSEPAPEKKSAA